MTHAAMRPSTATRRTGGGQPMPDGPGPRGEHDLRGEQDLVGDRVRDDGNERNERNVRDDRDDRDERNSRDEQSVPRQRTERGEQDGRRGQDSRREQDLRGEQGRAGDRDERGPRGEQWDGDRGEFGGGRESRREPGGVQRTVEQVTDRVRGATPTSGDALASTPDMSKVVTAWFDLAFDMMKLQQQFFANMLGAGNTNERNTTKV